MNKSLIQYTQKIILVLFLLIPFFSFSQEKWEFSNSTPKETVKSHLYFLEKGHYDPVLSSYALAGELSEKQKVILAKKLKAILLKHNIKVEELLDKRRGVIEKDKYVLFFDMPEIYLVRHRRKWQYSKETVNKIEKIYTSYVLKIEKGNNFRSDLKNLISKKVKSKTNTEVVDTSVVDETVILNQPKLDLSTPYATIVSHLLFLDDSLYLPELAAQTINLSKEDSARGEELAIKLKQIYLASPHEIFDIKELSVDTNYIDTISGKHIYHPNVLYPELYLEKIGDKWLYSRATSKLISSVHEEMYSEDAEQIFKFSDRFKKWAGSESRVLFYDVKLWQILMIFYFVLIGFVFFVVNRFLIRRVILNVLKQSKYKRLVYKIYHVSVFILFYRIVESYLPALEMEIGIMHLLHKFVKIVIIFNTTILSFYIVNVIKIRFTKEGVLSSTNGLIMFMALIIKTIIFITSLLFLIKTLDFNLVNVLAGLSIGGFALALGAQDTIKNFFGSLMIFADKQFAVGDWISSDKISGTVEEVGLRTTKIRTFHNSVVVVPNSMLADNSIDNMGRRTYRRYKGTFVIKFDTPTEKIDAFIGKIKQEIKQREDTRKDFYMVYINDFSTYGLEILVYVFFKVPDWNKEMQGKHELIKKVLDSARELEIEFAIPPK